MVPQLTICITHCLAVASPHFHVLSAVRYHQLYGAPSMLDWSFLTWPFAIALTVVLTALVLWRVNAMLKVVAYRPHRF